MKKLANILVLLTSIILFSCNSSKKSDEVASYKYKEEKVEMSNELKAKIPDWVEEGKICYGIVVQVDSKSHEARKGKPVRAKVVQINANSVTMKALETVSLVQSTSCDQQRISKGQTWEESDGDLYLSLEEAIEALKKMKLYEISDKVTVD